MAAKILLIDNEESTIQLFVQVARAFNIDYQILYNWGRTSSITRKKDIKVIFVNVELNFIDLQLLMKYFYEEEADEQIAIFFLFSKSFNKNYLAARRFPHQGELKKPLSAQDLFKALKSSIDLDNRIAYPEGEFRKKIQAFRAYYLTTKELVNKLEAYFE